MANKYNIIFNGVVVPQFERQQVQHNLASLLKIDINKAAVLFTGKSVVLKKGVDETTAEKYQIVLRRAGAIVRLQIADDVQVASNATDDNGMKLAPVGSAILAGSSQKKDPPLDLDLDELSLAFPGSAMQDNIQVNAPLEVDVSDLIMDDPGVEMSDEIEITAPFYVDLSAISLSNADSEMTDERHVDPPLQVDTHDLELNYTGTDILAEKERTHDEPINPDTSELILEKEH